MTRVIGVSGPARVGKDVYCRVLKTRYGTGAAIDSIARPIKEMCDEACLDLYGISAFTEDDPDKEKVRDYLVQTGEYYRTVDPLYWVSRMWNTKPVCDTLIVSSVRYKEEAEFLQERGGEIVMLSREGVEPKFHEGKSLPLIKADHYFDITAAFNAAGFSD